MHRERPRHVERERLRKGGGWQEGECVWLFFSALSQQFLGSGSFCGQDLSMSPRMDLLVAWGCSYLGSWGSLGRAEGKGTAASAPIRVELGVRKEQGSGGEGGSRTACVISLPTRHQLVSFL